MNLRFLSLAAIAALELPQAAIAGPLSLELGVVNPSPDNNDLFGAAISLSGSKALIGSPADATTGTGSGRAYIYDAATGTLLHTLENPAPVNNGQFGGAVAMSGNIALVGAQNDATGAAGAAYIFNATTGGLALTLTDPGPTPIAGDSFGHAVAISGSLALVSAINDDAGATNAGAAYLFNATTGALLRTFTNPTPASADNFGYDVALLGNRALISTINDDTAALNAGAAYLFDTATGTLLHTFLNPTPELNNAFGNNDNFGFAVALSANRIAISAPNDSVNGFHSGVVYLYDATSFSLLNTLVIPTPNSDTEEFLGNDIALSDDYLLAGAPFRNIGPTLAKKDVGAAFLYNATTGAFLQEIDDTAPTNGDRFGFTVALDGDNALVGAQTDLVGPTVRPGQVFAYETAAAAAPAGIPEPGTWMLLLAGLTGMTRLRRRA